MRISDWSSDVCSSDLEAARGGDEGVGELLAVFLGAGGDLLGVAEVAAEDDLDRPLGAHDGDLRRRPGVVHVAAQVLGGHHVVGAAVGLARSEEHTSELQSLMRTSYAVFCLKQKTETAANDLDTRLTSIMRHQRL